MKVVSFFLAVLISALALMPCTDAETCEHEGSEHVQTDHHDHSEDEEDTCAPFCYCSCCGVVGLIVQIFSWESVEIYLTFPKSYSIRNTSINSTYVYSFWQPPKIS